jgi:hypothetical protein
MSNLGKILTVRFKIVDEEASKVLWKTHADNAHIAGCSVRAIGWGDKFAEANLFENRWEAAVEYLDEDDIKTIEQEFPDEND